MPKEPESASLAAAAVTTTSVPSDAPQAASEPETFAIDGARSSVRFAVRFGGVSTVRGTFRTLSGNIRQCPDARRCGVEVSVNTGSIETANRLRDRHLRSAHYFDVARFPDMAFHALTVERRDTGIFVAGPMTIHGITRDVEVTMHRVRARDTVTRTADDARIRFRGRFTLDRADFDVRGRGLMRIADGLIGRNVSCEVDIEAVR